MQQKDLFFSFYTNANVKKHGKKLKPKQFTVYHSNKLSQKCVSNFDPNPFKKQNQDGIDRKHLFLCWIHVDDKIMFPNEQKAGS